MSTVYLHWEKALRWEGEHPSYRVGTPESSRDAGSPGDAVLPGTGSREAELHLQLSPGWRTESTGCRTVSREASSTKG